MSRADVRRANAFVTEASVFDLTKAKITTIEEVRQTGDSK